MELDRIVVGADFSAESGVALSHSLDLARHTGAEVVLINVCPVVEPSRYVLAQEWIDLLRGRLAASRAQLEELRQSVSGQGASVTHMVIDGAPEEGLVRAADELMADLVAVGTHGFTGIKRLLLGSVAERVVRTSPCSVLVARDTAQPRGGYRHILVPTDFSPQADAALAMAGQLVARQGRIDVRHYWQEPLFGPLLDMDAAAAQAQRSASERGAELIARHRSDEHTVQFTTSGGYAAQRILEAADREPIDLVVIGSHGRRGLNRWLLGSVAETTARHARCSVLVVRGRAAGAEKPPVL